MGKQHHAARGRSQVNMKKKIASNTNTPNLGNSSSILGDMAVGTSQVIKIAVVETNDVEIMRR